MWKICSIPSVKHISNQRFHLVFSEGSKCMCYRCCRCFCCCSEKWLTEYLCTKIVRHGMIEQWTKKRWMQQQTIDNSIRGMRFEQRKWLIENTRSSRMKENKKVYNHSTILWQIRQVTWNKQKRDLQMFVLAGLLLRNHVISLLLLSTFKWPSRLKPENEIAEKSKE